MATTVQPEKLLKDLAKLWIDLGKHDEGVLRACALTLIATVEEDADAQNVSETIARLMHQHPSRVIVLRAAANEPDGMEARVFAQCWMPFGRRQQICCEQIEITASREHMDDLPKLVLGLIAPDLPVVLWCRSERLARDPAFQQLFSLTSKIVIDSAAFMDSAGALNFARGLIQSTRNVGDLAWTRLTPLREIVAQIFENREALAHVKNLRQVEIDYAGPAAADPETMPTCLRYLLAWFRTTLPVNVELVFADEQPVYEIRGIHMDAPGFIAEVKFTDSMVEVSLDQLTQRLAFPKRGDCDLLREELSIAGIDRIYRRCLG